MTKFYKLFFIVAVFLLSVNAKASFFDNPPPFYQFQQCTHNGIAYKVVAFGAKCPSFSHSNPAIRTVIDDPEGLINQHHDQDHVMGVSINKDEDIHDPSCALGKEPIETV
ncbi:hypothetical protein [Kangiella sp. HZ709]|uniref:hypothetical protein n=1 Tax=Kangiella sp. HZ709 TaxID=2666328 RepID=UPI0012B10283|nr:hypothetical protein [Kangiella sp. HZ709]MRX27297.1 hypothetical protein [Kangiella sp. HZ709]